jgi:futalosine hydrolase
MRILLVFATSIECAGTYKLLIPSALYKSEDSALTFRNLSIDILITGVGMMYTCFYVTKKLQTMDYDLVINAGIAGAFDLTTALGSVFLVSKDRFGDLGIEDTQGNFTDVFEAGLTESMASPFKDGWLYTSNAHFNLDQYKKCTAITVNKVTGNETSIQNIFTKYQPGIESMEGAACLFVANMFDTHCLQLRSISNHVEPRDKSKWQMPLALENLSVELMKLLETLSER